MTKRDFTLMEDFEEKFHRWEKRTVKRRKEKDFTSDNRKSVRWLYENAMKKFKHAEKFLGEVEETGER